MFLKIVILCVFSLQACKEVSCWKCTDSCRTYSSCKEASHLTVNLRDADTTQILNQAYCGYDSVKREIKVCCSDFKHHLLPDKCGGIEGNRIVGGRVANMYEFPWMALISYRSGVSLSFDCAGTIINPRYILTAAHCVHRISDRIAGVRVGEYDLNNSVDCQQMQGDYVCESHIQDIMKIEKVIVHEKYSKTPIINDIALLRLGEDIDFNHNNVAPVCLPIYPELRNKRLTGERATVTGWGITESGRGSSVLMKVLLTIKGTETCKLEPGNICAGAFNKDSCNGDSGGPLILEEEYNNTDRFVQFGIVSNGPSACGSKAGAVYTDVRKYVDWILDNMEE